MKRGSSRNCVLTCKFAGIGQPVDVTQVLFHQLNDMKVVVLVLAYMGQSCLKGVLAIMNVRMRCFRGILTAAAVLLSSLLPANATTNIVIFESSFESPWVPDAIGGDHSELSQTDPYGWDRVADRTQIFNENNTNLAARVPTPYGEQYISIWGDGPGHYIFTTNITDRLQPGVTYTLTFNVGNAHGSTGSPDPTGNNYLAELLAGTNVLASVTGTTDSNDFSAYDVLTYTPDGTNSSLGEIIGVRIAHDGPKWEYRTIVDNVKLVADESASEWQHTLHMGK